MKIHNKCLHKCDVWQTTCRPDLDGILCICGRNISHRGVLYSQCIGHKNELCGWREAFFFLNLKFFYSERSMFLWIGVTPHVTLFKLRKISFPISPLLSILGTSNFQRIRTIIVEFILNQLNSQIWSTIRWSEWKFFFSGFIRIISVNAVVFKSYSALIFTQHHNF